MLIKEVFEFKKNKIRNSAWVEKVRAVLLQK